METRRRDVPRDNVARTLAYALAVLVTGLVVGSVLGLGAVLLLPWVGW